MLICLSRVPPPSLHTLCSTVGIGSAIRLKHLCSPSYLESCLIHKLVHSLRVARVVRKEHKAAVLGLHLGSPDVLVSACQDKHVRVMDLRAPFTVSAQHRTHQSSVLCVAAAEHYIYSGGEDKKLHVWDLRNSKLLQKIQVEEKHKPSLDE